MFQWFFARKRRKAISLELARAVHDGEIEHRLRSAILRLPTESREIVTLSRFHGLSHAEIAERTGKSEAATRRILHHALVELARSAR